MARKLTDIAIIVVILSFVVSGFSLILLQLDTNTGVDSGTLYTDLNVIDQDLTGNVDSFTGTFTDNTDNTSTFDPESDTQVETRNSESSGIVNLLTKNILVNFINLSSEKLGIPSILSWFAISLIGIIISGTFLRFFWSDSRI